METTSKILEKKGEKDLMTYLLIDESSSREIMVRNTPALKGN